MKKIILSAIILFISSMGFANVRLPKVFGDSMVLQRDQPIPIWGWADSDEKITVQFNNQAKSATAGKDGKWKINLDPEKAGGPYQLTVKGANTLTMNNILVGEVWVCSGQSNMEWTVKSSEGADKEIKEANFPQIRHFYVTKALSDKPKEDIGGNSAWKAATAANVADFTAVGYFFAKALYKELNVPIGLLHTSWGGTDVETWISPEAFGKSEEFGTSTEDSPKLILDSIAKRNKKLVLKKITELQGGLPNASSVSSWKEFSFDDGKWPTMTVPGQWEGHGLPGFDGVVWFRKTVNLTADEASKPAIIDLGKIDDSDVSYVNGVKVGGLENQYNLVRTYQIEQGILKEGKNVIAIRVTDTGGGGGISGEVKDLKLTIGNKSYSIVGDWSFQVESIAGGSGAISPNIYPSLLFNAMINPLIPFGIKGAIWYQGENNAGRAYQYRKSFPLMITDWRQHWGQGNFPFYFVQLASFNANNGNSNNGSAWAELREAQTLTLSLPNTGMAVITDIGESNDIHPRNKIDVGKRLAAIALHQTYNKDIVSGGPVYQSIKVEGKKVKVSFTNLGSGLKVKDGANIQGFELAGSDRKFYEAKASIQGNYVVVYHEQVKNPVAVRYAWADDAGTANLYNKEGFPAWPFRTDQWKGVTEEAKYIIPKY